MNSREVGNLGWNRAEEKDQVSWRSLPERRKKLRGLKRGYQSDVNYSISSLFSKMIIVSPWEGLLWRGPV
jgi:hypothetical protein